MKNLLPYLAGILVTFISYMALSNIMYSYQLAEFYNEEHSFSKHWKGLNGRGIAGDQISVLDL